MFDIIIPVLNEEKILTENAKYYSALKHKARVVFVDGGSTDRTVEVAQNYGEVIASHRGRAIQKNRGAEVATGECLLFLHVDSFITDHALKSVSRVLTKRDIVGGCFTMRIQDKGWMFRLYEMAVNFRAKAFGVIDGDLGTFVRRDVFAQLGGFDCVDVMEDLMFGRRMRKAGLIRVLPDHINVSSRRWRERGFVRTFLDYTRAYLKLWTGRINPVYPQERCYPVEQ